ncbi:hypothetical protein KDM87_00335 [Undibacterium sp. FT147W]|uniref:DoxX family protein n=1 Tax=Undibacterium rivi TaxID=2828729 RepID=A0ABS5GX52_9BURK|nr:hypothetical protein [Undibacterium rivi]MBR7791026.1 hypothetical protein [Undibacterium rivi]
MRTLLSLSLVFAALLIALKVGLSLMGIDAMQANSGLKQAQEVVDSISTGAWQFGQPLLQLVVVLALGEWFVSRLGLKVSTIALGSINIQTFIAIAIVFSFCLAALGNLPGLSYLKDVVLIVIGFYFGTRSKQDSGTDVVERGDTGKEKSDA